MVFLNRVQRGIKKVLKIKKIYDKIFISVGMHFKQALYRSIYRNLN